jgi:hypothetical protein
MLAQSHDSVRLVQQDAQFQRFDLVFESGQIGFDFFQMTGLARGRFGGGQIDEHMQVIGLALGERQGFQTLSDRPGLVDGSLGLVAVVPEVLSSHLGLEFGETFLRSGDVKETSEVGLASRQWQSIELLLDQTSPETITPATGVGKAVSG